MLCSAIFSKFRALITSHQGLQFLGTALKIIIGLCALHEFTHLLVKKISDKEIISFEKFSKHLDAS